MPGYCCCEADVYHMIGPYMNRCHCEGFFSIDLSRINNDIEEENLKEIVIERNTCIYDLNDTHIIKVGDIVMNIKNVMKSGIVVAF